jgi:hypothetical protein
MNSGQCTGCGSAVALQPQEKVQPAPKEDEASQSRIGPSKFKTVCAFLKNGTCSKTLMNVLDREFENPMKLEEQASDPLAGGMMQGYQCGMLWGSTLAAGAQAHKLFGSGPQAEAAAMRAAEKLVQAFRDRNEHIDCGDITETDPKNKWKVFVHFFVKGGTIRCAGKMANFAPDALKAIDSALSEKEAEPACKPTCDPASCAARLAKKMGASDKHAVMAAGLAGGIGFSGSGCGALGAAIWLLGVNGHKEGLSNKVINARVNELMERFLKISGYEYECAEIVGHKFEDLDDHAAYLQQEGCAELIEALAEAAEAIQGSVPTTVTEKIVQQEEEATAA